VDEYEALLGEYKEALADVRLHSGLMFGELTVYLAASGALLQIRFKDSLPWSAKISIAVAGIILSFPFYVLHERFGDFVHVARNRARELEKRLCFSLYSSSPLPRWKVFTAINAARFVFIVGALGWLGALLQSAGLFH
jgi:hypothetical protein